MGRTASAVIAIVFAVLLQSALVNRLPLPWGVGPDLVVLVVTALALRATPSAGALAGFTAGLAMDVMPPAEHEIGRYALVLGVAGYMVGSLRDTSWRSGLWPYGVAAMAVFGVALGYAFVGAILADPRVSLSSTLTLGGLSVVMTMLVSPLVLTPMLKVMRRLNRDRFGPIGEAPWIEGVLR
ncbi:rod shape-determining protein MreD [Salinactinospora qingdaonensis]|uniref:Rod shape-determining protein MreD n=1 Tax=Salinactinospora qingdaonensis TaxID=702744 RepID=A0ABP7ETE1_9ACTN